MISFSYQIEIQLNQKLVSGYSEEPKPF